MNSKTLYRCIMVVISMMLMVGAVSADAPIDGRAGRAEVRFLEGMIDHHQMALDMAMDCLNKAETEAVVTLCEGVITAQSAEIAQMQAWLLAWYNVDYAPVSMMSDDDMGDMDMDMGGMTMETTPYTDPPMMMGMMAGLSRLEGVEYEIAWLESMIDHHDDALHMAERILLRAQHPELVTLAELIISAQTAEIELMELLIVELSA